MSRARAVREYMTASPHTVGREQPLATARALMREHGIRHLPVLHGGRLVGVLSARDLNFVESLRDVDPTKVTVEEAMAQEPYAVPPGADLAAVAAEMAEHRYGCAVVTEGARVVGVFTTVDGMRALAELLRGAS